MLTAACYMNATLVTTAPARARTLTVGEDDYRPGRPVSEVSPLAGQLPPLDIAPQEDAVDPETYVVGPGDLLSLHLYGRQNVSSFAQVNPQGRIFIPNVGLVRVAGLALKDAEKTLASRIQVTYPRLGFALALARPRRFVVQVAGLVQKPGMYQATPLTRVSSLIEMAGGRLPGGSLRHVEVQRRGGTIEADLHVFYARGDRSKNPFLLEGDVVYVPKATFACTVGGAVHKPGTYELTKTRTVGELIELAGGLTEEASAVQPALLTRRTAHDTLETTRIQAPRDATIMDVPVKPGDTLFLPSVSETQRRVFVIGAVGSAQQGAQAAGGDKRLDTAGSAPREFTTALPFHKGDTARTVIERAGGLLPWADARAAFVERRKPDGGSTKVPLDAYALLVLRDLSKDILLEPGDAVYVPAVREGVMVSGPVYRPGLYQHNPRYTALDYINLAGGPTPNGTVSGAKVITADGRRIPATKAGAVSPGDTIAVTQKALTTFEWVQILLSLASITLSATAIAITLKNTK